MVHYGIFCRNAEYSSAISVLAARGSRTCGRDLVEYFKEYAREKPEVAALWCFGIGFILGWKLKPW